MRNFFLRSNLFKNPERSQTLVLIIFIVIIFSATIATIASLTTRELEMEEIQERALKVSYVAESGVERGIFYLKGNSPSNPVDIKIDCTPCGNNNCSNCCPDSTGCNSNNCNCDKNPLSSGYGYEVRITPRGKIKLDGKICQTLYCVETFAKLSN